MATPAVLIERKRAMAGFGAACALPVPAGFNASLGTFGGPAERFLAEIQRELGAPRPAPGGRSCRRCCSPRPRQPSAAATATPCGASGTRPLTAVALYVLHDMENADELQGRRGDRLVLRVACRDRLGALRYDDDSIEQYLPLDVIPWGAPSANIDGVHIEQMGLAAWSTQQWFCKAAGTLMNTAWALSWLYRHHAGSVPLRALSDAELRAGERGVTTHRQITRVLGGGTHTDPGPGYPLGYVIRRAHVFAGI